MSGVWAMAMVTIVITVVGLFLLYQQQQQQQQYYRHHQQHQPPPPGCAQQQPSQPPEGRGQQQRQEQQPEGPGVVFSTNVHEVEISAHLQLDNLGQFAFRRRERHTAQSGIMNLGDFNNTARERRDNSQTGSLDSLHWLDQDQVEAGGSFGSRQLTGEAANQIGYI